MYTILFSGLSGGNHGNSANLKMAPVQAVDIGILVLRNRETALG
jgi:hypothetical protein